MKRKVCFVVLVVFISFIAGVTTYTLMNKGIKDTVTKVNKKEIELVNENVNKDEASILFNVYLNDVRHKFKITYDVEKEEKKSLLKASIYFDGRNILNKVVINDLKVTDLNKIWSDKTYESLKKGVNELKRLVSDSNEFLLFEISSINSNTTLEYFVLNTEGILLDKKGILARDSKKAYESESGEALNIFYDDSYLMAKINDDTIYTLVEKTENKKLVIEEYRYKIKKNEFEKELVMTYSNVKLKNNKK